MRDAKFIKNLFSLFSIQGLSYLMPLITLPYLVRVLGVGAYGELSFWQAVAQYGVLLVNFGFLYSAPRQISQVAADRDKVSEVFFSVLWVRIICAALIASFLLVSSLVFGFDYALPIAFLVFSAAIMPTWYFQGVEKMGMVAFATFLVKFSTLPILFYFVNAPEDAWLAFVIGAVGDFILGGVLLAVVLLKGYVIFVKVGVDKLRTQIKQGWHVFVSRIGINIYSQSTTVILGLFASPEAVGVFSAADKLRSAVQGLLGPLSSALYPRMVSLFTSGKAKAYIFLQRIFFIQVFAVVVIAIVIFLFSGLVVSLVLGEGYENAIPILEILIWVPVAVAISNIFGVQALLAQGRDAAFSRVILVAGIFHVTALIPMVLYFQETGAALMILITESLIAIVMGWCVISRDKQYILRGVCEN